MRIPGLIFAALLAGGAPVLAQEYDYGRSGYDYAETREIRSVRDFEAPLARYGRWVSTRWGRAWAPNVWRDWRPYTVGAWVDGQDGREWRSDEPWGWATYHYGRWGFDDRLGWVWVPDTEYAPAWVAFRDGDDYTGWAPLPPQSSYGDIDAWDYNRWYAPSWIYVPRARFYSGRIAASVLPWRYNRNYWDRTQHREQRWDGRDRRRDGDRRPGFDPRQGDGRDRSRDGYRPGAPNANSGIVPPRFDNRPDRRRDGDRNGRDRRPEAQGGSVAPPPVVVQRSVPAPGEGRRGDMNGRGGQQGGERGRPPGADPRPDRASGQAPAPAATSPVPAPAAVPAPVAAKPAAAERPQRDGRPRNPGKSGEPRKQPE